MDIGQKTPNETDITYKQDDFIDPLTIDNTGIPAILFTNDDHNINLFVASQTYQFSDIELGFTIDDHGICPALALGTDLETAVKSAWYTFRGDNEEMRTRILALNSMQLIHIGSSLCSQEQFRNHFRKKGITHLKCSMCEIEQDTQRIKQTSLNELMCIFDCKNKDGSPCYDHAICKTCLGLMAYCNNKPPLKCPKCKAGLADLTCSHCQQNKPLIQLTFHFDKCHHKRYVICNECKTRLLPLECPSCYKFS